MDISSQPGLEISTRAASFTPRSVSYPAQPSQNKTVSPLLPQLNQTNLRSHLEHFTSFYTRYYKSSTGRDSSAWLLSKVNETVAESGALKHGASVRHFEHSWGQNSVIATLPGRTKKTVVIGAHQDSINLYFPSLLAAPGADDDGSGTVTILEALRVILQREEVVKGEMENTLEFHWYSAEEGGLLGSQAIFYEYKKERRDVFAMLQQDMTGYIHNTLKAGKVESVGVIEDYVDPGLTNFIKKVVTQVREDRQTYVAEGRLLMAPVLHDPVHLYKMRIRLLGSRFSLQGRVPFGLRHRVGL